MEQDVVKAMIQHKLLDFDSSIPSLDIYQKGNGLVACRNRPRPSPSGSAANFPRKISTVSESENEHRLLSWKFRVLLEHAVRQERTGSLMIVLAVAALGTLRCDVPSVESLPNARYQTLRFH